MKPVPDQVSKKPYQPPKLHVYGNLAEMTQSTGRIGKADGAKTGVKRHTG
jgi:hypothetical protein